MNINDNLLYVQGALATEEYLRKARVDVKMHRKLEPQTLRCHEQVYIKDKTLEFQVRFMDVIGAFILSSLDGVTVGLFWWDILHILTRTSKQE